MAVYKVIQDIEAEDKIIGFLSLKALVYAAIAGVLAFLCFRLAVSGLGEYKWGFIILMFPPMLLFGLLAAPFGKDQPTEVWLLSHLKFFLKSKKRVWNKGGMLNSVIITAPKKIEKQLTKNLSQEEVKSRLQALANTLDSRGWALKNVDVNAATPSYFQAVGNSSERLVSPSGLDQSSPVLDIHAKDDIMDPDSNAIAQNFDELMKKADQKRKQELLENFNAMREGGMPMSARKNYVPASANSESAPDSEAEKEILDKVHAQQQRLKNHPHFQPKPSLAEERQQKEQQKKQEEAARREAAARQTPAPTVTPEVLADRIELVKSGNAFSVASLSQLANRHQPKVTQLGPNEVEIDLH